MPANAAPAAGRSAFRAALLAALQAEADGRGPRLTQLAETLIGKALAGERWAIREVMDRLDGRPAEAEPDVAPEEPRKIVFCWSDTPAPAPAPGGI